MIIASGFIILGGFGFVATKLSAKTNLRILGMGIWLDVAVSALAYALHWGTFTGVMAAAFAGMLFSASTWLLAKICGYIKGGIYFPGWFNLSHKVPGVPMHIPNYVDASTKVA